MYSKLYARITESSLMEEPINVRYTFVLMLAIADPEGYVIGTNIAIARRLNMDLGEFEECLGVLMSPDANSNSKDHEGRRVLVSDGERGYRLVNYVNYRDMKSPQDRRDYMREYMRKRRGKTNEKTETVEAFVVADDVSNSKPPLAQLRHAEAEAEEKNKKKKNVADAPVLPFESNEFLQAWQDFVAMRSEIKKTLRPTGMKLALEKLKGFGESIAIQSLKESTAGQWQGLYEPKNTPPAPAKPHDRVCNSDEEFNEFMRLHGGE